VDDRGSGLEVLVGELRSCWSMATSTRRLSLRADAAPFTRVRAVASAVCRSWTAPTMAATEGVGLGKEGLPVKAVVTCVRTR